ncbi:tetraspanin-1-like isoform X2 [Cydia pomonella]|uniref:tetraspanin-1-like isoform X2 n=1 Tax=Cydia pomonella TaxID=82600 RepID=UPI002ADDC3CE|nr:tetraspanin-1-like isoform X2 [Cydia pomonella]
MGMSRCYSLMKCLLILFNIVFLVIGLAACGLSVWALWEGGASASVGGTGAGDAAAARAGLCAVATWGGVLALGAIAALWGAARDAPSLLAAAFALLALCGVAEAAAACWGAAHLPQLRRALSQRLHYAVRNEYGHGAATQLLDTIQAELKCCGAEGARDWQSSVWSRAEAGASDAAPPQPDDVALDLSVTAPNSYYYVPPSCCLSTEEGGDSAMCAEARRVPAASGGAAGLHQAACAPKVIHALESGARLPLATGAALLALHALALLLALALCLRARPAPRYKA